MALWHREHRPAPRRQCRASHGVRFRFECVAAVVSRAVKNMDSKKRKEVQEKSRKYLEKKAEMVKSRAEEMGIEDDSEVPTLGLRLSCPLLDEEGACRIYESRPIVCRKFGMPLYDPKKPDELQCCELNFQGGIKIDADELIKNQMTIYDYWMQFKTEVNEELQPEKRATTIAEAILYDYEEMLEKGWRKPREL